MPHQHETNLFRFISHGGVIYTKYKANVGHHFYEIYFSADLATVSERDVKGLYAKAKNGEIDNLIGYSPGNVYQPPEHADCIVNSGVESMIESVEALHSFIIERLNVRISCKN